MYWRIQSYALMHVLNQIKNNYTRIYKNSELNFNVKI